MTLNDVHISPFLQKLELIRDMVGSTLFLLH